MIRRNGSFRLAGDGSLLVQPVGTGKSSPLLQPNNQRSAVAAAVCSNDQQHQEATYIVCNVRKLNGRLGMGLAGGEIGDRYPLHVCDVPDGGAAAANGAVQVGDQVLAIDGVDMTAASYTEAVTALMATGDTVRLQLSRDPARKAYLDAVNEQSRASSRASTVSVSDGISGISTGPQSLSAYAQRAYAEQPGASFGQGMSEQPGASFGQGMSPIRPTSRSNPSVTSDAGGIDGGSAPAFNLDQSTPPKAPPMVNDDAQLPSQAATRPGEEEHVHSFVCGRLAARGYTGRCTANDQEAAAAAAGVDLYGPTPELFLDDDGVGGGTPDSATPNQRLHFEDEYASNPNQSHGVPSPGLSPVEWETSPQHDTRHGDGGHSAATRNAGAAAWGSGLSSPDYIESVTTPIHDDGVSSAGGHRTVAATAGPRLPAAGTPKVVRDRDLPGPRSDAYREAMRAESWSENRFNSPRLRRKGNRKEHEEMAPPSDFVVGILSRPIAPLQPVRPVRLHTPVVGASAADVDATAFARLMSALRIEFGSESQIFSIEIYK
jgi:hypothetical protein